MTEQIKAWELPFVEDERQKAEQATKTNAINKRSEWVYEPPEQEQEPEMALPTAEQLEEIRQSAYQEGLEQGLAEGRQQGTEQGLTEGREQGYAAGFEQGQDEGLQQGQQDIQSQLEQWQNLNSQLVRPTEKLDKELEIELVQLATSLARAVIRTEVTINSEVILQALNEGLKVLPLAEQKYQIRLHPDDMALIKAQYSEQDIQRHQWYLVEAPELSRGGCDIVTENNAVDMSVERRCRDILDKFLFQHGLDGE